MRIVVVCGGRDFSDRELLCSVLDREIQRGDVIVHGGCRTGADAMADEWARERGLFVRVFQAEWSRYGRSAGPKRNREMAKIADLVIAFPGGASMLREARVRGVEVRHVWRDRND